MLINYINAFPPFKGIVPEISSVCAAKIAGVSKILQNAESTIGGICEAAYNTSILQCVSDLGKSVAEVSWSSAIAPKEDLMSIVNHTVVLLPRACDVIQSPAFDISAALKLLPLVFEIYVGSNKVLAANDYLATH